MYGYLRVLEGHGEVGQEGKETKAGMSGLDRGLLG